MTQRQVTEHYGRGGLGGRILAALAAAGKDVENLLPEDLAPVEEFHSRGRAATDELFQATGFRSGEEVLDVGSGIGGPARYLARRGLRVTGIDLTAEFCEVARDLTRRSGLADQVEFHQGDALALPFGAGRFDGVWMQHANMNIRDKRGLCAQIVRVLRPGGRFALHEILQGPGGPPHFPTPWASGPDASFLMTPDEAETILGESGLMLEHWKDDTEATVAFFDEMLARNQASGPPPLGTHLLFGADSPAIFGNYGRSLRENRCRVVQAVAVNQP